MLSTEDRILVKRVKPIVKRFNWAGFGMTLSFIFLFALAKSSYTATMVMIVVFGMGWMILIDTAIVQSFKKGREAGLVDRNQETTGS
jgi:VanZ family protein